MPPHQELELGENVLLLILCLEGTCEQAFIREFKRSHLFLKLCILLVQLCMSLALIIKLLFELFRNKVGL